MREILHKLVSHQELSASDLEYVVHGIRDGLLSRPQLAAFLMGLVMKGVTPGEVARIVSVMRANCVRVLPEASGEVIDTCGTGGGIGTFNVSTANSIMAAAAGIRVAKHGSRSIAASSGSADVLEALGVASDLRPDRAEAMLRDVGYAFLHAPHFHPIMRNVFGPEQELGIKTIFFTVVGPLINPAGARRHVLGVYQPDLVRVVAEAARELNYSHLMVVHGVDGLDEVSTVGETLIAEVRSDVVQYSTIRPGDFGLPLAQLDDLRGGSPTDNARIIRGLFDRSDMGPRRDFLLANTAATLVVSGRANGLRDGVALACQLIDSGKAKEKLEQLIRASEIISK